MTPPKLVCPNSYVKELIDEQSYLSVNFNENEFQVNATDESGQVTIQFIPERANIPLGSYENVTVLARDRSGNTAHCNFQVLVKATNCVDWDLNRPRNGIIDCLPSDKGLKCVAACNPSFRFTDGDRSKTYTCEYQKPWSPSRIIPDCVQEKTQQADYQVTAHINYRSNGAVAQACLSQYTDVFAQHFPQLSSVLTQRCSAVNVDIQVSFIKAIPNQIDDNKIRMDYVLRLIPVVRQTQLYDLCGSTLNLIFDLSVPYASAVIDKLLNVSSIGNICPPLRALKSTVNRGFTCNVGEVLNMDTNDVPQCLHCPAGTFANDLQKECAFCPRGYYQNRDKQGACLKCPAGTYTRFEGSKSGDDCVPVCGYGTYSPNGLVPCLQCPNNSYSQKPPVDGFKDCQACPQNTFTYQSGAYTKDLCRAKCGLGQYSPTGLAPCSQCPFNYYQSQSGKITCMECPSNMVTNTNGAKSVTECLPIQCKPNACQHGGLCIPTGHGIQCLCPAGFTGKRCEIDIDECSSQPCYNGATCIDLPQNYSCRCADGYWGINCEEEKSECTNNTCPTRAMCKDEPGFGNVTCLCKSGYTGVDCDVTINPCDNNRNLCNNGATCRALKQGRFSCECQPGWEGQFCEINIDDCSENPCLLNANCTDLVNDFTCSCPSGFTGNFFKVNVTDILIQKF